MSASSGTLGRRDSLPGDRHTAALLVSGGISALTLAAAFGLLAVGVESFWVAFVVGFGFVLPTGLGIVGVLYPEKTSEGGADTEGNSRTPIEELESRFARGELSRAEFERRAGVLRDEE